MLEYTTENEQDFITHFEQWIITYGHNPIPEGLDLGGSDQNRSPCLIINTKPFKIITLTSRMSYYADYSSKEGEKRTSQGLLTQKLIFGHVVHSGMHVVSKTEKIIYYPLFFNQSGSEDQYVVATIDVSRPLLQSSNGPLISIKPCPDKKTTLSFKYPVAPVNYSIRGSTSYSKKNEQSFIALVRYWVGARGPSPCGLPYQSFKDWKTATRIVCLDLSQEKICRKDSGLPFSILCLGEGDSSKHVAISNMQAGIGGRGRVKVVYPLIINLATKTITIEFNKALALKIITDLSAFEKDKGRNEPTEHAINHYQRINPDYAERYRISASKKHTTVPINAVKSYFESLKSDGYFHANKKYYTIPLYPGIDGWTFFNRPTTILTDRLTPYNLITLLYKFAIALKHFHDQKLVHGDLKENNFLVDWPSETAVENADVYLIDCDGLAVEGQVYYRSYNERYCPPELRSLKSNNINPMVKAYRWQDIYSLGVTMMRIIKCYTIIMNKRYILQDIIASMTNKEPSNRITIDEIISILDCKRKRFTTHIVPSAPAVAATAVADRNISFTFESKP